MLVKAATGDNKVSSHNLNQSQVSTKLAPINELIPLTESQ